MGFRFYRRIKIAPGISLNVSGGGLSLSTGVRGARVTFGPRGITRSLGIPGTGMSIRDTIGYGSRRVQGSDLIGDRRNDNFVKELAESGPRLLSLKTQEAKEMYEHLKTESRIELINPATGRKFSLREFEAKIRQMEIQDKIAETQRTIQEEESLYQQIINHWKTIPRIPNNDEVISALNPLPFKPSDIPPIQFDPSQEKNVLFEQIVTELRQHFPLNFLPRGVVVRKANRIVPSEWDKKEQSLKEDYERQLRAYELKLAADKKEWETVEQERIKRLQAILNRNLAEIHVAAIELIQAIHFPYETSCEVFIDDEVNLYLHLDLPEIEDIIPTHRKTVLKNGNIKEVKIDKLTRNRDYFNLVIGQGVLIACTLCSTLPTVPSVRIAAYTQRKRRAETDAIDTYVYDIIFLRQKLSSLDPEKIPLLQFVLNLHPVMDITEDMHLSGIQSPEWIKQISKTFEIKLNGI